MKKSSLKLAVSFGFAVLAMNVYADQGNGGKGMDMGSVKMDCMKKMDNMKMDCMGGGSSAVSSADAEVRKVDLENKKITLKHGPIKNLNMPGMTMVFPVKDPAMLSNVKSGDKVKFTAENIGNIATVTSLEVLK